MGLLGWIFYISISIKVFLVLKYLDNKYSLTRIQQLIFSNLLMLFVAGINYKLKTNYNNNIFLIFVIILIFDVIYQNYIIDDDFFNRDKNNLSYYTILIVTAFYINQEFINKVNQIFLTGSEFRSILWLLSIFFLYSFFKEKDIIKRVDINNKSESISEESIFIQYAKFKYKYQDICHNNKKSIENILYSLMIYYNFKRNKVLRFYDNIICQITHKPRKQGIMQIDTKEVLTDEESIKIIYDKLKILVKKKKNNKSLSNKDLIKELDDKNYIEIQKIFDIIMKF